MSLLVIVLVCTLGIGGYAIVSNGHVQKTAFAQEEISTPVDNSLSVKIQQLRGEMKKNISASDYAEMERLSGLLVQVLSDKGSISLSPSDIIGNDSNYELKYIDEITVNDHKQRIVQFKHKQGRPFTYICAQNIEKNSNALTDVILADLSPNKVQLVSCNLLSSNNKVYLSLVLKCYCDKTKGEIGNISAYTWEYNAQSCDAPGMMLWKSNDTPPASNIKNKHWRMQFDTVGNFYIDNDQADYLKGTDFVIKVGINKMDITLVDKNKQPVDTMHAIFENGQWQPN